MAEKTRTNKKKRLLGQYEIIKSLAKGGMGEVFLAKDLTCNRIIALKKIRSNYLRNETIHKRFLREAHLTAQLSHPSIIPIYSIHTHGKSIYYTMPYVEGKTVRELIHETKKKESAGKQHPIGSSIPALMGLFLHVCEAIAYAHSKGILHRDIKPENIIVGKYGEVLILDWGLIDTINPSESANNQWGIDTQGVTKPGKIAGTLPFMAPERVLGKAPSPRTDIYSLGVMLYQLLTLRLPFFRTTLPKFRKQMKHERLLELQEVAPYRDIPEHLAKIAKKCLHFSPKERFQSVSDLIDSLKHYIEGQFEWVETTHLDFAQKKDWEFQENIPLAKHIAISQEIDVREWVYLMVSKEGYSGNTKVMTRVRIKEGGSGVGLLLCVPETSQRKSLEEGYCLWVSSQAKQSTKLFRNNVEVYDTATVTLKENQWQTLVIEKIENNLYFYLNGKLAFRRLSHLPLTGTHLGLLFRDANFEMEPLTVSVASHNATINCLSVPDAFFAAKNFHVALSEYRKIGTSFVGRTEGREALFRAGLTLLEEGKTKPTKKGKEHFYSSALEEFGKLHTTPAAPLEYLGKALVYREMGDIEEEIKCFELCLRKFPKHPLLPPVIEQITFRLHETSDSHRTGAYRFALLALRFLPYLFKQKDHKRLLDHLTHHWTTLSFLEKSSKNTLIALAFWQAKPLALLEIAEEPTLSEKDRTNALFALTKLDCTHLLPQKLSDDLACIRLADEKGIEEGLKKALSIPRSFRKNRLLSILFRKGLDANIAKKLLPYFSQVQAPSPHLKHLHAEALLYAGREREAKKLLFSLKENSSLVSLQASFLALTKGKKAALRHLQSIDTSAATPTIPTLLPLFLKKKLKAKNLFHWERIVLLRQLVLFSHCLGEKENVRLYRRQLKKTLSDAKTKT